MIQQRKKRNSSKVNLAISVIFHSTLVLAIFFFAAREGILGKKLKQITVTMVPKEKKPEPPKEKPPEPKAEPPKVAEAPKPVEAPPRVETAAAPPPVESPVAVAPAAAILPDMQFTDGAKDVQISSNPAQIYGGLIERALRSHWNRPADIDDGKFVAEVNVTVDGTGQISNPVWEKGSGNPRWDQSVRDAIAATKGLERPPPKDFPGKFLVRFDVQTSETEAVMQLGSR